MSWDNNSEPAVRASRVTLSSAMLTFATVTVPPLATALDKLAAGAHPQLPMMNSDEQALYRSLVIYVNRLIARGDWTGAPLPLR